MWCCSEFAACFRRGALIAFAVALSGCGFHPLYGKANAEVAPELQSIKIVPISDRIGQQLRNLLYSQLTPDGEPARPKYKLDTILKESASNQALQQNQVATRANLGISARYSLTDLATGQMLANYTSQATASYDIVQSEFATLSAQKDAERRAIKEIGDDMTLRLSLYFSEERNTAAAGPKTGAQQAAPQPGAPQPAPAQPAYAQPVAPQYAAPQYGYPQYGAGSYADPQNGGQYSAPQNGYPAQNNPANPQQSYPGYPQQPFPQVPDPNYPP